MSKYAQISSSVVYLHMYIYILKCRHICIYSRICKYRLLQQQHPATTPTLPAAVPYIFSQEFGCCFPFPPSLLHSLSLFFISFVVGVGSEEEVSLFVLLLLLLCCRDVRCVRLLTMNAISMYVHTYVCHCFMKYVHV